MGAESEVPPRNARSSGRSREQESTPSAFLTLPLAIVATGAVVGWIDVFVPAGLPVGVWVISEVGVVTLIVLEGVVAGSWLEQATPARVSAVAIVTRSVRTTSPFTGTEGSDPAGRLCHWVGLNSCVSGRTFGGRTIVSTLGACLGIRPPVFSDVRGRVSSFCWYPVCSSPLVSRWP